MRCSRRGRPSNAAWILSARSARNMRTLSRRRARQAGPAGFLSTALAGKVRAALRAEDKDRVREWRAWLEESWSSDQGAVYRWPKDESYAPPVTFLSKPDGTATANFAEMDGLLQDAWRPINRKFAWDPEPHPAAFPRRYG